MPNCSVCSALLRPGARYCTRCGSAVALEPAVAEPMIAKQVSAEPVIVEPVSVAPAPAEPVVVEPILYPEPASAIPTRIPPQGRVTAPPARSTAATWAFVTGVLPLLVSVTGNLVSTQLGLVALQRLAQGDAQGAWAPVLVTLTLVFVANAALLTVCTIAGGRGLRETANGITRGRGLAVAGLAAGGVNLVLWVAGLIVSISGLAPVLV